MSDSDRTNSSKTESLEANSHGASPAFWVLFALLFAALLIANATAVFYQRRWHRQLAPLRADVVGLKANVKKFEDLKSLANQKLEQEKREHHEIRSMLRNVRSTADMPIDPTLNILRTSRENWLGDKEGTYSVFFSIPAGEFYCGAEYRVLEGESLSKERPVERRFSVTLESNSVYEFRLRHFDHTDEGCHFTMQLFDRDEGLLAEKEFLSESKYESKYTVVGGGPPSVILKELLVPRARGAATLLDITLLDEDAGKSGVNVKCYVMSSASHAIVDVLNIPLAAKNSSLWPGAQNGRRLRESPVSSRYFYVEGSPLKASERSEVPKGVDFEAE